MNLKPPAFSKITLTRLWIALALLGSVLTFSGQATQSSFLLVSGTLSELVVPEYAAGKKAISYQRPVSLTLENLFHSFCFCQPQLAQTLFRHNQLGSVKLTYITRLYRQFKAQNQFFLLNSIPSYPEHKVFARLI